MPIDAILFDAYGTLLDVGSLAVGAEALFAGKGAALVRLWREKQLAYSWLRTLSGRYVDFEQVTADALDYGAEALGLALSHEARRTLLAGWRRLTPFADAGPALDTLARDGTPLAVLSNGTPGMLAEVFERAGLRHRFSALISVDAAQRYKTAPEAYQLTVEHFGVAPERLLLVSSNGWDAAGAGAFGLATFWVNRGGAPVERLGSAPTGIGGSLADLPQWLATRR